MEQKNDHISTSQLGEFLKCQRRWKLSRQFKDLTTPGEEFIEDPESGTVDQKAGKIIHTVMAMFHHLDNNPRNWDTDWPIFLEAALTESYLKDTYVAQVTRTLKHFGKVFGNDNGHKPDLIEHEVLDVPLIPGCDLTVIFDDITFNHEEKTIVVGEYKSSLKPIDVTEKLWLTHQPMVEQFAVSVLWPDYRMTGMLYTLLWPSDCTRVFRPIHAEDVPMWERRIKQKAKEMMVLKHDSNADPFPNFSKLCHWCPFWESYCQQELHFGEVINMQGYIGVEDVPR